MNENNTANDTRVDIVDAEGAAVGNVEDAVDLEGGVGDGEGRGADDNVSIHGEVGQIDIDRYEIDQIKKKEVNERGKRSQGRRTLRDGDGVLENEIATGSRGRSKYNRRRRN
jgi:hypothetical protein